MGEPPSELLPARAEFVPCLRGQLKALLLVTPEHIIQLASRGLVDDDGILLKVTLQTAGVEVGTANSTISTIRILE